MAVAAPAHAPEPPAPVPPPVAVIEVPEPVAAAPAVEVQVPDVVVSEVSEVAADDVPPEVLAAAATEPVAIGANTESRERLIVAAPIPLELDEPMAPEPVQAKAETPVPVEVDVVLDEPVEEAPVSSRRAVVAEPQERLAEMAFGAEEQPAPRHTPPPASGRLLAVQAEPGDDGDITGVRETGARPPPPPAPAVLAPEATQAQLAPSDKVAELVAAAQAFAPATFVALLDASLSL
jgi:hypothetical protein